MGRRILTASVLALLFASRSASAYEFTGECAVFFDRGHYWIEMEIELPDTGAAQADPDRHDFTITDGETGESFNPSRVEIVAGGAASGFAVLSSGKLKGRRCYTVRYGGEGAPREFGPVCDPAGRDPVPAGGAAAFFRDHVAPAFSAYGGEYRWNRLIAGYDITSSTGSVDIELEPVFEKGWLSFIPFFVTDGTTYWRGGEERSVSRIEAGADAAARAWTGPVRLSLDGGYSLRRETLYSGTEREAHSARIAATVRLDNLLDRVNRHALSVFKGVDAGAGYAWYDSTEAGGDMFMGAPLLAARATWTLVSSLQLSYRVEACRPEGGPWRYMHGARVRLLLRGALEKPEGRSYHPDLELAVDWGRRLPFLEREERVLLGFTFDLYPW